jgi:hypothetical protein
MGVYFFVFFVPAIFDLSRWGADTPRGAVNLVYDSPGNIIYRQMNLENGMFYDTGGFIIV